MNVIGTTLVWSSDDYFSQWLPLEGDAATFTIIALNKAAGTDLTVKIQKKDRGDADPGTDHATIATFNDETGTKQSNVTTLDKDLYRLKYTVSGIGENEPRFYHFDVPTPAWERS